MVVVVVAADGLVVVVVGAEVVVVVDGATVVDVTGADVRACRRASSVAAGTLGSDFEDGPNPTVIS